MNTEEKYRKKIRLNLNNGSGNLRGELVKEGEGAAHSDEVKTKNLSNQSLIFNAIGEASNRKGYQQ
jgi:hypothetical protein